MKHLFFYSIVMIYFFTLIQEKKLIGKYKMEYDYNYGSQNGIITFSENGYLRKQVNGKKVKGNIEYQQYFVLLNDKNSHLQVKFPKREINNDTIFFRTTDLNNSRDNNDPLTIYGGKLIKIK